MLLNEKLDKIHLEMRQKRDGKPQMEVPNDRVLSLKETAF